MQTAIGQKRSTVSQSGQPVGAENHPENPSNMQVKHKYLHQLHPNKKHIIPKGL